MGFNSGFKGLITMHFCHIASAVCRWKPQNRVAKTGSSDVCSVVRRNSLSDPTGAENTRQECITLARKVPRKVSRCELRSVIRLAAFCTTVCCST